ncbi:thiopurine S-methyltransferase [Curvivirga sp.]|uniref:thiopurine S-methyltransferase n=1 Tax=Curvivirga sp. TaxID=2856848 RepID=UPI003B59B90D
MDVDFWQDRWESNQIAFHQDEINRFLVSHIGLLNLYKGDRVFVPLCGKTLDIHWLLKQGFRVIGAELSLIAVEQLFDELQLSAERIQIGSLIKFSAENIEVFVGDIFDLADKELGQIDAIYDRAALVALPEEMRKDYSQHLIKITATAPQLLLTFEYDQEKLAGPPFSIPEDFITNYYENDYSIKEIDRAQLDEGIRDFKAVQEICWLLK